MPSILYRELMLKRNETKVLNLIISGMPSILSINSTIPTFFSSQSFKPYYKWNAFNTIKVNGKNVNYFSFKPYYKWNAFNTVKKS